jgi:hypothetical protein
MSGEYHETYLMSLQGQALTYHFSSRMLFLIGAIYRIVAYVGLIGVHRDKQR